MFQNICSGIYEIITSALYLPWGVRILVGLYLSGLLEEKYTMKDEPTLGFRGFVLLAH